MPISLYLTRRECRRRIDALIQRLAEDARTAVARGNHRPFDTIPEPVRRAVIECYQWGPRSLAHIQNVIRLTP